MARLIKVRMKVSIASATWSYQPGQVVLLEADQAKTWIAVGHAEFVEKDTPLTSETAALSAEAYNGEFDHRVIRRMRGPQLVQ